MRTSFLSPALLTAAIAVSACKNDAFVGINIPAYTSFSVQLGYKDTRYSLVKNATIFGDIGGLANLRFRF